MELKSIAGAWTLTPKTPFAICFTELPSVYGITGFRAVGNQMLLRDVNFRIACRNSTIDFLRIVVFCDPQGLVGDDVNAIFQTGSGTPSVWPYNQPNLPMLSIIDDFVVPLHSYLFWNGVGVNNADMPYFVERAYNNLNLTVTRGRRDPIDGSFFCQNNFVWVLILHDKIDDFGFSGRLTCTVTWNELQ